MARKKTRELIEENEWLMTLKPRPRMIVGLLRYQFKKILILVVISIIGFWIVTSFNFKSKNVEIKPGVKIEHKTIKKTIEGVQDE